VRTWPKFQSLKYYRATLFPTKYFGSYLQRQHTPIFIYHVLEPVEFEEHLSYLKDNGYCAISCEDAVSGKPDPKKVILSFDDGRRSVWTVAYPLLKKYGFKGVAFVSPGLVKHGDKTPTIEGAFSNEDSIDKYRNFELFNWEEAQEMHDSGVIDLQLHGYAHSRIFLSDEIQAFANPGSKDVDLGVSAWQIKSGDQDSFLTKLENGQPVYKHGSRWGGGRRYFDDEELRCACIEYVSAHNSDGKFFENPTWEDDLRSMVARYCRDHNCAGVEESRQEQYDNLVYLLSEAKSILKNKIGKNSEHFALPWARGDKKLITKVAKQVGVKHIYWAYLDEYFSVSDKDSFVNNHPRIKDTFLRRLDGKGKQSIIGLFLEEFIKIKKERSGKPK